MIETAQLAGFFAAHGVWSISDGETLIPILGYEHADGERELKRLLHDDTAAAARAAQEALETNEAGAVRAVFVADAYVPLAGGRTDALLVEAVEYGLTPGSLTVAVPYRPRTESSRFAVYRPAFLEVGGPNEEQLPALADAFFGGVDSHEQAAAVWSEHLIDQSV